MNENLWLNLLINAARAGMNSLKNNLGSIVDANMLTGKVGAGGDLTTRLDIVSENAIVDFIKNSQQDCSILTEEAGEIRTGNITENSPIVIIDPLDGTNNLKRGFPFACISIALMNKNEVIVGVILDLATEKIYYAVQGRGAWEYEINNKKRLSVSQTKKSEKSFITMIRPVTKEDYFNMADLFFGVKTTRIVVSAALEMVYVAAGITDAFVDVAFNKNVGKGGVRLVDFAAGKLIIEEAGGYVWGDNINEIITGLDIKKQTNLIAGTSAELVESLIQLRWNKNK